MAIDDRINARFQELLKAGEAILQKHGWDGKEFYSWPSELEYNQWYTSAKNLIEKTCSRNSPHYKQIEDVHIRNKGHPMYISGCIGVLQAAYDDLKLGLLEDTKALITAEVFSDFIEQAEYLLEERYKLPAAVLVRAVLEDGLRTLCNKHGISLPDRPKLDWMNSELTKAGVYNKNVQKQIAAWAGIGNSAAHGKLDEFKEEDVKNMISGVISFNAAFLK